MVSKYPIDEFRDHRADGPDDQSEKESGEDPYILIEGMIGRFKVDSRNDQNKAEKNQRDGVVHSDHTQEKGAESAFDPELMNDGQNRGGCRCRSQSVGAGPIRTPAPESIRTPRRDESGHRAGAHPDTLTCPTGA